MAGSIREAEARKGWLFATRIKALKGESQGGFGLKHGHSNVTLAIAKGAKRVRDPAGAGGRGRETSAPVVRNGSKPGDMVILP
jgi:hypothetical protein